MFRNLRMLDVTNYSAIELGDTGYLQELCSPLGHKFLFVCFVGWGAGGEGASVLA